MFQIVGEKQHFDQWDLDQLVTNPCMKKGDSVVFNGHGKTYGVTAFEQNGEIFADVPNFLLQKPGSIRVDLNYGLDCHMDCRTTFTVVAKEKPTDYSCDVNIKNREAPTAGVSSWNDLTDKPFYEEAGEAELDSGEYTSVLNDAYGAYCVPGTFHEQLAEYPDQCTITLDGAVYEGLRITYIEGLGRMCGNLSLMNSLMGTSFENTGEPFFVGISMVDYIMFVTDTAPTKHNVRFAVPCQVFHSISHDFVHIPTFDLNEMGLAEIKTNGGVAETVVDSAEFFNALKNGCVRIIFTADGVTNRAVVCANFKYSRNACYFHVSQDIHMFAYFAVVRQRNGERNDLKTKISGQIVSFQYAT